MAAGHVAITAGTASADVIVSAGALPVGTVLWSNPGDGSGVDWIVPAVPSPSGVDVFAFQGDGTVQAITSDGATAWTVDVGDLAGANPPYVHRLGGSEYPPPNFQGGLVGAGTTSVVVLDGMTGQRYPPYTVDPNQSYLMKDNGLGIHPDGTVFIGQWDDNNPYGEVCCGVSVYSVVGIDPISGTKKFAIPLLTSGSVGQIIVAGDGYAYCSYAYGESPDPNNPSAYITHLMVLRVDSTGAYEKITIKDWNTVSVGMVNYEMITNADQGILFTWEVPPGYPQAPAENGAAMVSGTGVSLTSGPNIPGQWATIPQLQAQDGSFFGVACTGDIWDYICTRNMVAFDQSGNLRWSVPGFTPQIATDDGGVIATDSSGQQ